MTLNERLLRLRVDSEIVAMIELLRSNAITVESRKQLLIQFIQSNQAVYQSAFTQAERDELQASNTTLQAICDHIKSAVPELPR